MDENPRSGFEKISRSSSDTWMCVVYGPKDGTFNVRLLHGPEGFYMDVDGRATQEQLPR